MVEVLLHYIVWIGIILFIVLLIYLSSDEIDIKISVWYRLIMSILVLVIGNVLMYKYYHEIGTWAVLRVISVILVIYACLDIPAKIAGVFYKRKLAFDDFSINPFDMQLNKLGYKPLILSLILLISQFIGCSKMNDYYDKQLNSKGVVRRIVIKDKQYRRIQKNVYDSVIYFDFQYKKNIFEGSVRCRGLDIGDTATIMFDPLNIGNCELIKK